MSSPSSTSDANDDVRISDDTETHRAANFDIASGDVILPLAQEQVELVKQTVIDGRVIITRRTVERQQTIEAMLTRERVNIEHVPKGIRIETMPEVREEHGVLIVPVVEEQVEIVRTLVLKEELHITKVKQNEPFQQEVTLRRQEIQVERQDLGERQDGQEE